LSLVQFLKQHDVSKGGSAYLPEDGSKDGFRKAALF